mgnify:CR=1 FL=1
MKNLGLYYHVILRTKIQINFVNIMKIKKRGKNHALISGINKDYRLVRFIGIVIQRAPPPPRGSSEPSIVITYLLCCAKSTLLARTSLALIMSNPALFIDSIVWLLRA